MHQNVAVGFVFLFVGLGEGGGTMVNLTEVAEKYLKNLKDSSRRYDSMDSWGLTANYEYWTGRHFTAGEKPIRAKVIALRCEKVEKKSVKTEQVSGCNKTFTWNIKHGMQSPFQLLVNVTVPMVRNATTKDKSIFEVDLNNAEITTKNVYDKIKTDGKATLKMVTRKCSFKAEVTFTGFFAFHIKYVRGDNPNYYSVNVISLENGKDLSIRNGSLLYTVDGDYTETWCRDKRKRRSARE